MAVDATLVSAIRSDGTARRRADRIDGMALWEARRRKEHPRVGRTHRRARLVVMGPNASKSGAGGRKRCNTLFLSWPGLRQEARPTSCSDVSSRPGESRWGSILAVGGGQDCGIHNAGVAWRAGR